MADRKPAADASVAPLRPQFRARNFTDAAGKSRFGMSVTVNGSRFTGSVRMRNNGHADAGGIADLLESLATFVRQG